MKFKKWLNKVTKIFVVLGMVLSMCFTAGNTNTVEAWDSGIPHEFTRIKSITYPEWWKRKCPQITKQWSTYMCKYNGQWSYCLEASKRTPSSGNYAASVIENNDMVRKFLYYGFGGPNGSLFKGQALTDDGLNEEETGYLYTHVLLSLAYSGDMCGANIDDLERAGIGLKSTWSYVESLPDPSNGANFSTGDTAKFTATFDKANMIQTTNTVSFNASSNETVQLPLQSNVTIHIAGSSAQQTGGTATVWGGQSFYLTAPLENSPTDYTSGTLNSSAKGKFCALAISDGNGSNQTHGSWTQESVDSLRYSIDWLDFGWIDLIKKSANEGITNNNGCYSLEGAVYGIYSDGVKVDEITTDKNGYAKSSILPVGNYTVKEITASTGYDLDENTYSVTVVKDQTVRANSNETPGNDPIGIEVVKNDAETKGMPQGDATLEGAEFTVKYYDGYYTKDDLPKKATRTWVIATKEVTYSTGKKGYVARLSNSNKVSGDNFYTDENGAITLPLGTISIEETKAPKGYLLKGNTLNVTDNLTGVTTTEKDTNYVAQITKEYQGAKLQFGNDANQMVVTEKVKKQKIQIFKSGYRNGMSEVVKGLQGAEFAFKLKSEVDHVGWDNATVYDVVTTNEDGLATTKYLPFGEYLVRETVTPKDYYTNPDFTVSITKDHSEYENEEDQVKKVVLNNRPVETQLKLVKQDEETGKTVSLNSASFKIVADEDILDGGNIVYKKGQYITQKVGGKKYDTFTTNSDNVVVVKTEYTNDDDEKGEVFLPLQFFAGKYHLEEVKVPTGFIGLGKTQSFEMSGLLDYTKDEDGDPIYTVTVRDEQPKAQIKLNKTVADLDTDVDLVDRSDLSKIQFVLKAKENIYSPVDGSLMFAKDDVITTENSGAIVNSGTEVGNGVYALSTDGHLDISNLPMGVGEAQYYLQEVKTLDGCVLDTTKYDAVFKQSDYTTKTYIKSFDVENLTTDFEFNKTDVTGDKEVEGAQLTITDEEGNVVDQWTSTDKVHSIEGLVVGKTYILSETVTAKDYVKATDIKFTVKNSSELETVTMKDKQVSFTKTDVTGEKEVEGATITVTDKETKEVVDTWVSGKDSHFINGLEEGRTYILSETVTPEEYVKSTDIEFTVSKEKVNEKVNMKDKQVKVSKLTVGGEEVIGAHMQIIDEDGNVVDEWYSEGKSHIANGLEEGKTYTLHEDLAPTGLNLANDFTFEVTKEKQNQTVEMIDTVTEVNKTDVDGKAVKEATLSIVSEKTKDIVDQWVTGQHIIDLDKDVKAQLEENGKAEGTYMDDEDSMVMFSIAKNKDRDDYTLMQVKDGVTTYANIDIKGNETTHRVQGLVAGEKYILRETKTPEEYVQAKEIEFTAGENENQTLVMKDKQVTISKTTVSGDEVTGALMQIKDEDGNIIDEWTFEGKVHYATGLVEGKKYTLHEDLAPTGLNLANDIEFEVSYEKENQQVEMIDTINEVSKVDEKGNLLKGAEMTVTSNKTKNIIDKWISGQHIFDVTDEMKAQLKENGKAEGMYVDDEDSTVQYSIAKNKGKDDYTVMFVKDGITTYTNIDLDGNETRHMIQGLEAGEEYVLKETKTPNGYATFKTQTFTAEEGKDTVLSMTDEDTKIEISKQDITTKKELEGAKLKVTDKDGNVVDEWTSGKQPHMIKNLTVDQTYTLTEVIAPKNYKVAESIQFTVKDTGVAQKVVMYDELMPVVKKVKTGDNSQIAFYMILAGLSICILGVIYAKKKIKD
ncbi:SpaA isopeptide-forming pilin-related protein [Faecalibacillus intestinalis]|uniref:SpaA isopeptide-forming pilin-related protein n=1 Tax=Faecalibacillus intestinalis TaxID=1982626 RepID=UPI003993367E